MVLHRMIILEKAGPIDHSLPESVYRAPSGGRFQKLLQLDFNSLVSFRH